MTARKGFDRALFEKYDKAAKEATIAFLGSGAREYTENRYAQDIIYQGYERELFAECEVKRVWKGWDFPYDSVQLPERKKKFFDKPTLFFIWNEDCTRAATFWSHMIEDLEPVEVPNRYIRKGEYFFQVPLERVIFTDEYDSTGHRDQPKSQQDLASSNEEH